MSFHSYFVRLGGGKMAAFTSTLLIDGLNVPAEFKRIGADVYMVFFKSQLDFFFNQELKFRKKEGRAWVLFPVLSKYNQRKLKKWVEFFATSPDLSQPECLCAILAIDKFIEVRRLLPFFRMDRSQVMPRLLQLELEKKIKLIDIDHLSVTAYGHFEELHGQLAAILQQAYEKREKSLKLSDIEKKTKIPIASLFFKYLLQSLHGQFEFMTLKGKLSMQKLPLSENEKDRIGVITQAVRRQRLDVFAIDQISKLTALTFSQLNDTLWHMASAGQIVQLDDRHFIFSEDLQRIINRVKKYKRNQGDLISIDAFRILTGLSRKYLIVLFEYFDDQHVTERVGNKRKIILSV